jgi:hypothetical protein
MGLLIYSYNCFWAFPDQWLSNSSPTELTIIFYSLILDPQSGGQGPRIYIPQEQGGPVMSPGFLFVASYDSQAYGGGILTGVHTGNQESLIRLTLTTLLWKRYRLFVCRLSLDIECRETTEFSPTGKTRFDKIEIFFPCSWCV